jgi:hypothetical protein
VRHLANDEFWRAYRSLPDATRELADRAFALLKSNPRHPSLKFKTIGRYRSVRVGIHHRALAVEDGEDLVWFWIGSHADYDAMIR